MKKMYFIASYTKHYCSEIDETERGRRDFESWLNDYRLKGFKVVSIFTSTATTFYSVVFYGRPKELS